MSDVKIILVDINKKMIEAWQETFEDNPEVQIVHGSMLDQQVDAWVSPTNSYGSMDGGLDAIVKSFLGGQIEKSLKAEISRQFNGKFPLGTATCVETGKSQPRYLISTPTMHSSSENVSDSLNTALACAAAFQIVKMQNKAQPGSIKSIAIPGLGANTGRVPVENCADLMWTAYSIYCDEDVQDFAELRTVLEQNLGDLTPMNQKNQKNQKSQKSQSSHSSSNNQAYSGSAAKSHTKSSAPKPSTTASKDEEVDFDDFD